MTIRFLPVPFVLALAALSLSSPRSAAASNFCEHGGKKYSIGATRCEAPDHLRCVAKDEWKKIGECKAPAPAKGPQFCEHGGKKYSIGATRCEGADKLRCVAKDSWKRIAACK